MTTSSGRPGAAPPSQALFELFIANVVDYAIFTTDVRGFVVTWNAGAERIKGYRADEIIGQHFSVFYPPEEVADGKPEAELAAAADQGRFEEEGWRLRKDGTRFWANSVLTAVRDERGEIVGFGKVVRDLTPSLDRVGRQQVFTHLVRAQETERRRIAWDVHDDSIQSMIAVSMRLQMLAARQSEEVRTALAGLDESIQETIARLRALVAHLRPPVQDSDDLVSALRAYLDDVVEGWGLECTLRQDIDVSSLTPEVVVNVFRIVQEAMVNVRKHASASRVDVVLAERDGGLLVRVSDDGVGMDAAAVGAGRWEHVGLSAMRERAEAAQGWLTVDSAPGAGVTIEFWMPEYRTRSGEKG
ncbi:PAS domain S-box protein [Amycolatopsis sp. NPDC059027]|uniref:PAS domain-containing sensor histidine kinase n=1 Tax=unclassified Amycolatopsis TaxID=2618356 RepID=UPI00366C9998